jgi:hypothetical protein
LKLCLERRVVAFCGAEASAEKEEEEEEEEATSG